MCHCDLCEDFPCPGVRGGGRGGGLGEFGGVKDKERSTPRGGSCSIPDRDVPHIFLG